jgi:flagellar capping protein FliD
MKAGVAQMQAAGQGLAAISVDTPVAGIEALLQNFVERYNHWRKSFNADVEQGGLLDNMRAAEVSLYELEQSMKNRFFGTKDGLHGLGDLGIRIDPVTHLASLDGAQLQTALGANKQAAVNTLQDFSLNFAKSAALLNAENNFIPNQLANLNRVIQYIRDNHAALTQEFGTGDTAKPTGRVAEALAAYTRQYA